LIALVFIWAVLCLSGLEAALPLPIAALKDFFIETTTSPGPYLRRAIQSRGQVQFLIPVGLASDDYTLEVRSKWNFGKLHNGNLNTILIVN
jgi:hypothetical protein